MDMQTTERLIHLLAGINLNDPTDNTHIYWSKTHSLTDLEKHDGNAERPTYVFGTKPGEGIDAQLLGDFGSEGDELVLSGSLIVETCAFSTLPYTQIVGPTYLSFESEADLSLLRESLSKLADVGVLPAMLTRPEIIFELASFSQTPANIKRFIADDAGTRPFAAPEIINQVRAEQPSLASYFLAAVLIAKRLKASHTPLTFDLPADRTLQQSSICCWPAATTNITA